MFFLKKLFLDKRVLLIAILALATVLRFYRLGDVPHGLYIDEVSIGYNADKLLHTGADEYGVRFPIYFKSLGDYKPGVIFYLTAFSMKLFGKTDFAVRFPSAFFGVLAVLFTYLLVKQLKDTNFALSSSFLLAISQWHLQFSRAAFEVNIGLTFFLIAGYFMVLFWQKSRSIFLFLGTIFCLIPLYTYHSYKFLSPVFLFLLLLVFYIKKKPIRKIIVFTAVMGVILSIPLFIDSQGNTRLAMTLAFNEYPNLSFWDKLTVYPTVFLKDYLSYFSFTFLFSWGDRIGRHEMTNFGMLAIWQLPFVFYGLIVLIKKKITPFSFTLFSILLLAPIPAAIASPSPHGLRSLLMVIPFIFLVTTGLIEFYRKTVHKKIFLFCFSFIFLFETLQYFHYYYQHYGSNSEMDWGGKYEEMIKKVTQYSKTYTTIFVSSSLPEIREYIQFYNPDLNVISINIFEKKPKQCVGSCMFISEELNHSSVKTQGKVIDAVYLDNPNKNIFAEFWEL